MTNDKRMIKSKRFLVPALLLLLAVVVITIGYQRFTGVDAQLADERQRSAELQAELANYEELAAADDLFHAGDYPGAVTAYRELEHLDSTARAQRIQHTFRVVRMAAALDTLNLLSGRPTPIASPTLAGPAPAPVQSVDLAEANPNRLDSLSFALRKAQLENSNLRRRLDRNSGSNYLTFESRKGNEVYYVGEIKNGKAHGDGVALLSTGSRYLGQWKAGLKHGTGEFHWPDGAWYEGEYENDERSGRGTYHFPKGGVYIGEWAGDLRDGKGVYYDKKGKVVAEGLWRGDELVE